ncbi:MAG: hypothetical protein P8X85_02945, partial [Desulfobacterales bacterium]
MNDILTLLKPRIWPLTNRSVRQNGRGALVKVLVFGTIGLLFWLGIFAVALRVLTYFRGIEEIGDILGYKLLSMILIVSFALLIFSGILTSLSKLYLSRDLQLVHAMPVASYKIFTSRWIDSTVESAWMVVIFTLPVFLAYGIVYQSGFFYYANTLAALTALAINASAASTILVMVAVIVIPANRLKSIFIFLGILFFVVVYLAIRLSRPELLVDPEVFDTVMVYISSLETPQSPVLPSTWAYDSILAGLTGSVNSGLFHTALAWSFAATIAFVLLVVAEALYFQGFSKTQTASARLFKKDAAAWR